MRRIWVGFESPTSGSMCIMCERRIRDGKWTELTREFMTQPSIHTKDRVFEVYLFEEFDNV